VLTDTALKNLRPKARAYKSTDRDGMYVYVSTGGAISFRYDYRFNGRRETLTLGRYGRAGLTLAQARQRLIEVKKAIADGVSPAVEKQRAKRRLKEAQDFAQVAQGWMDRAPMADSTRDMRRAIFNRDVLPKWKNRLLSEITPDDLKGAIDEQLAPPAPPAEPMQAEYEQAQREFAVANQPQDDRYPGLRETPTDELQRMATLLASKDGQQI
jgi:hypothetical protein